MTKLTKNRKYPYPISAEDAAGALDIERLARAFDRDTAAVDAAWQGDLQRPSATWTATESGILNGFATEIRTGGAFSEKVGLFDATWLKIPAYWLFSVDIGLTPTGTITANSARTTAVQIAESGVGGLPVVRETYQTQDFQADATVWMSTEFVTLVDPATVISYLVNHANVGSTVNATLRSSMSLLVFA